MTSFEKKNYFEFGVMTNLGLTNMGTKTKTPFFLPAAATKNNGLCNKKNEEKTSCTNS